MIAEHLLTLREDIITTLLANVEVTGIIGDRFYGEEAPANPTWPFGKYALPIAERFAATCWEGSAQTVKLDLFVKGPGMDNAILLAHAVEQALLEEELVTNLTLVSWEHLDTNVIRDRDEAGAYHVIIRYQAETA